MFLKRHPELKEELENKANMADKRLTGVYYVINVEDIKEESKLMADKKED